jgi:amidase
MLDPLFIVADLMASLPLHFKSLSEISQMIRLSKISSVDLTRYMFDLIDKLDGHFQSYIHLCNDRAMVQAQAADAEIANKIYRGPLHGVPIAVKDLCYTTFAPTRAGTSIYNGFMANYNATVVDRLETSGAVILGKLSMTEGAYTGHHATIPAPTNPWNPKYWVGTSSSGSGVGPSAGLCFASLGSDTGGSIRYPAATCGLTGIKPTYGRVSRNGIFALAESMDHIGPMARSAADCALVLQVIAGWDAADPTSLNVPVPNYSTEVGKSIRNLRIGFDRHFCFNDVDVEVSDALKEAIKVFEKLGAKIVPVTLPPYEELVACWIQMCAIETAVAHKETYPSRATEYGADLAQLLDEGHTTSGSAAAIGHHTRIAFSGALATMFGAVDCIICPTMTTPVPRLDAMENYGNDPAVLLAIMRYTAPFNFSGSPTITLPNGFDPNGLPLSMQLVGPHLSEGSLIRSASAYQSVTSWHTNHPDIFSK